MRKITEVLKPVTNNLALIAYVDNDTNELVSILDKNKRQLNKNLISELKETLLDDSIKKEEEEKIKIQITELQKEVDKIVPFEFELSEPTFDVISAALSAVNGIGGNIDVLASGKVVFDACYKGNQGELEEIQKYSTLYTSLCSKCYHEVVDIADIEYKKK